MSSSLLTALGAFLVAVLTGVFGLVNATRANRPAESNAQLAWVKQAQDEAVEARKEAREAKTEASAARADSEVTRQQQVKIRRELDAMQDWVDRVVRARDAYLAEHTEPEIDDTGMLRLLRAINGGPHLSDSAQ